MEHRIDVSAHGMQTCRPIDVSNRGQQTAHLRSHGAHLEHEWAFAHEIEVLVRSLNLDGWRERAEGLSVFDLGVDLVLHVGQCGIREDASVAERARPDLHSSLEPADDVAFRNQARRDGHDVVVLRAHELAVADQLADVVVRVLRAQVGIIVHVRSRLVQQDAVRVQGCPNGGAVVTRGGHHVDIVESGFPQDSAVHDTVERHAPGNDEVLAPGSLAHNGTQIKRAFLQNHLKRCCDVLVVVLEFRALPRLTECRVELRRATLTAPELVVEERQVDLDRAVRIDARKAPDDVPVDSRVAEWRKPHGLALVVVGAKPAKLRRRFIEGAERVGEVALGEARHLSTVTLAKE